MIFEEPKIVWTKELCPVCHEPTGEQTECYKNPITSSLPEVRKNMVNKDGGFLPILSKNCVFRQNNTWRVEINDAVTKDLLDVLSNIPGISSIVPVDGYKMVVTIGRLFDENEVKFLFSSIYKEYMAQIYQTHSPPFDEEIQGIILPNGQKFTINRRLKGEDYVVQAEVLKDLLSAFPDAKKISRAVDFPADDE